MSSKPPPPPLSPQAFFTTQLSLLQAEQATEVAETSLLLSSAPPKMIATAGLAILNLTISNLRTGMGGRTVIELALDSAVSSSSTKGDEVKGKGREGQLPEHGIRSGDIVRVGEMPKGTAKKKEMAELKGKGIEGVITRVGERAIWVAIGNGGSGGQGGDDGDGDIDALAGGTRLWV